MRIIVAMTGASGALLGVDLLKELSRLNVETHLIVSHWARRNLELEGRWTADQLSRLSSFAHDPDDLAAPVASGSFLHDGMVVIPCSMKTCAAIAHGLADNLIARAADVTCKERRKLILVTRETPLSAIHLKNMLFLAEIGVTIMPPVFSWYHGQLSPDEMVKQFTGRILDHLGIENDIVHRWGEN